MAAMELAFGSRKLKIMLGDITKVPADVIVNAANSALAGGGGVDGAIHRVGGPGIMKELSEVRERIGGYCQPGSAVVTRAGDLPAKLVFHAVGPIYRAGVKEQAEVLASCYTTCLRMAEERGARIISFPSISTGAYGYPVNEAAAVAIGAVSDYLRTAPGAIRMAIFVLFDNRTLDAYQRVMAASNRKPLQ